MREIAELQMRTRELRLQLAENEHREYLRVTILGLNRRIPTLRAEIARDRALAAALRRLVV